MSDLTDPLGLGVVAVSGLLGLGVLVFGRTGVTAFGRGRVLGASGRTVSRGRTSASGRGRGLGAPATLFFFEGNLRVILGRGVDRGVERGVGLSPSSELPQVGRLGRGVLGGVGRGVERGL